MNLDWLSPTLNVATNLSEKARQELRDDLEAAQLEPPGLADRLVRFLLDGDPAVLAELDERSPVRVPFGRGEGSIRLVCQLDLLDPILLLRLSAIWAALQPTGLRDEHAWLGPCAGRVDSAPRVAAVAELAGIDRLEFVRMFLPWSLEDWPEFLAGSPEVLDEVWPTLDDYRQASLLERLDDLGPSASRLADPITAAIVSKSAEVREAARVRFLELPDAARRFEELLTSSKPAQQLIALELYHSLSEQLPDDLLPRLRKGTRSKKVAAVIDRTLAELQAESPMELPPVPRTDYPMGSPDPAQRVAFGEALDELLERAKSWAETHPHARVPAAITEPERDRAFATLFDPEPWTKVPGVALSGYGDCDHTWESALELVPLVRLWCIFGRFYLRLFSSAHAATRPEIRDLRVLAEAARYAGFEPRALADEWFEEVHYMDDPDFSGIWPFFAEQPETLRRVLLDSAGYDAAEKRCLALRILAHFPAPPPTLDGLLWEFALTKGPKERPLARQCFDSSPGIDDRIVAALSDGKKRVRASAAEWLMQRRNPATVPAIRARLDVEKDETVRRALTRAIFEIEGTLEAPSATSSDLEEWADKILKRGYPEKLDWLDRKTLPALVWASSKKPVDPRVVDAWIVNAVAQKDPTTDFGLQPHFDAMEPESRQAFALELFRRWLQVAQSEADTPWQPNAPKKAVTSSAFRGLLSLVACGRPDAASIVKPAETYVRKYYGSLLSQSLNLLRLVSCIDDPTAVQLLVSIAGRFRTKSIQKEARKLIDVLAERRGWTRDEFADRTVPHADLDENRERSLTYFDEYVRVTRTFHVRLGADFKLSVVDESGKVLKSLPPPRRGEVEESAQEARAILTSMRKQVKEAVRVQTSRLHEALCTAREWPVEAWRQIFVSHSIMSLLAQRCVWGEFRSGTLIHAFRPLDDRTLTNVQDESIHLTDDSVIRLLHSLDLSAADREAWRGHLADYEVPTLFRQFDSEPFELPPERRDETEIKATDMQEVEAAKISRALSRLGYVRGPTYEGGRVHTASRMFSGIGIQAVIEHSGFLVISDDEPVKVSSLFFVELDADPLDSPRKKLGEIPVILLSECVSDFESVTRMGSGGRRA